MRMLLKDGKLKALTLSYDDGFVQDKRLVALLDANGIKCTFNINSGMYSPAGSNPTYDRMPLQDAVALFAASGHEVAVHGYTHPFLEQLDDTEVLREILEDRRAIERDYGRIARGMAYPFGRYTDRVIQLLEACGIAYARTVEDTHGFAFPENWLTLHPTCHHNDENLMALAENFVKMTPRYNTPQLFYLWGHSYEFEDRDNWQVIEQFAQYMGGREDIWYATNIELYDYVQAYQRIQTSYDKKLLHNPTAVDLWLMIDGQTYALPAGATLRV